MKKKIKLFMAGDSTMSIKNISEYPETGWGMPFRYFFSEEVMVINLAKNGLSTKTFQEEGRWTKIVNQLDVDDYVIIQFGHNDQAKDKPYKYTSVSEFKNNLNIFISDVRQKKSHPILMTPITRRHFDINEKIRDTHFLYAESIREIAKETQVDFIDMEKITRYYFESLGDEGSALRFMHIAPDLHPNYPIGIKDNTHLNVLGAVEVAQLVLQQLKKIKHPLVDMLRKPVPKKL